MSTQAKGKRPDDRIQRMAIFLHEAWLKYMDLFGEPPHGTTMQIAAMLELCPQLKEAIRLWDKQREELETR